MNVSISMQFLQIFFRITMRKIQKKTYLNINVDHCALNYSFFTHTSQVLIPNYIQRRLRFCVLWIPFREWLSIFIPRRSFCRVYLIWKASIFLIYLHFDVSNWNKFLHRTKLKIALPLPPVLRKWKSPELYLNSCIICFKL